MTSLATAERTLYIGGGIGRTEKYHVPGDKLETS